MKYDVWVDCYIGTGRPNRAYAIELGQGPPSNGRDWRVFQIDADCKNSAVSTFWKDYTVVDDEDGRVWFNASVQQ